MATQIKFFKVKKKKVISVFKKINKGTTINKIFFKKAQEL